MGHISPTGIRLGQVMKDRGLSRKEMADILNISTKTLDRYASGERSPSGDTLDRLVRYSGVDAGWLLTGEGSTARPPKADQAEGDLAALELPGESAKPLQAAERVMLLKALEVLRASGLPGQPDTALAQNIEAFHEAVKSHRRRPQGDQDGLVLDKGGRDGAKRSPKKIANNH